MSQKLKVDSHVHLTSPDIIKNLDDYRAAEPYFDLLCTSPKNRFTTSEELVRMMDDQGIDLSIVFGFGFSDGDNCRRANDYTIKSVQELPEKLTGFATVNPGQPGLLRELERCFDAGLAGVGEIMATGQGVDLADEKQMAPLCEFCEDHDWPLLVHLNEAVGHYYPGKTGDSITQGAALAENFPRVKFIFAHLGGGLCFYENMPEMRRILSNVRYDTAAVPFLYEKRIYDVLKSSNLIDKIVFGSDYPLLSPDVYLERFKESGLNREAQERILGQNILDFFRVRRS